MHTMLINVLLAIGLVWHAVPVAASPVIGPVPAICQRLERELNAITFLPNEAGYDQLRTENWSQTAWRAPACIVQPSATQQLQQIVSILVRSGTKFAIRSGGHTPSPKAANIDGGVLIDLGGFNAVWYDEAASVARIGAGLTWGEVYAELDKSGVTVVGGRVNDVGVGGLTLGSGLSYLSDLYGMACDNVVNYEVVLGDGSLVNANKTHASDLFWALKGGTNNFGIVTAFTLSTYKIGKIWAGIKAFTLDDLPALFDAMYEYQRAPKRDQYANAFLQGFVSNATIGVALSIVYLKPEESPAIFEPFYRIKPTADLTKLTTLSEFLQGQGPPSFPPRAYFRTSSFKPNKDLYKSLPKIMTQSAALPKMKSLTAGTVAFAMQPISAKLVQAGRDRGGNALGLADAEQTWFVINSGSWFEREDEAVRQATTDMLRPIVEGAKARGAHLPYLFMNDAGWDQDVIQSYGRKNVARLREAQARHDPGRVFQKLVPGGFKLP